MARKRTEYSLKTIPLDVFVSVRQAAELTGINEHKLMEWVMSGRVESNAACKISGREVLRIAGPSFVADRALTPVQRRKEWDRAKAECKELV